jgi:hypothetical protein
LGTGFSIRLILAGTGGKAKAKKRLRDKSGKHLPEKAGSFSDRARPIGGNDTGRFNFSGLGVSNN